MVCPQRRRRRWSGEVFVAVRRHDESRAGDDTIGEEDQAHVRRVAS